MVKNLRTGVAVGISLLGLSVHADDATFKLSGFGTASFTHSTNEEGDYFTSILQPSGVGSVGGQTSINLDTKAGLQGQLAWNKYTATVQVVSKYDYKHSYEPGVEWMNLKYDITHDSFIRGGRVVAPIFMISDYRDIGYAITPVRPPNETYFLTAITHVDGGEAGTRTDFLGGTLSANLVAGRFSETSPLGVAKGSVEIFTLGEEKGNHTFRLSYSYFNSLDVASPNFEQVYENLIGQQIPGQSQTLGEILGYPKPKFYGYGNQAHIWALGYQYDNGEWIAQTEFIERITTSPPLPSTDSFYFLGGYRIGSFTPYGFYAAMISKLTALPGYRAHIPDNCRPILASPSAFPSSAVSTCSSLTQAATAINTLDTVFSAYRDQSAVGIGLRYDFYKNMDLKFEFQRSIKPGTPSPNVGLYQVNVLQTNPSFGTTQQTANLFSASLDFVF